MKKEESDSLSKLLLGVVSAKFGPGAIGRIGTVVIAGLVVLTAMAAIFAFINIYISAAIVFAVVGLAFFFVFRAFQYAEAHPEMAAMDGAQISKVLTQQASMRQLEGLAPVPPYADVTTQNPLITSQSDL